MIYGSALHKAVQEFHRRHARGEVMSEEELSPRSSAAWTNEGFLSRDHEEARLAAGRATLRRLPRGAAEPGAVIPAYVEREFASPSAATGSAAAGTGSTSSRPIPRSPAPAATRRRRPHADAVAPTLELTGRERVTITDYKTSDVREPAKARQRARESLQLQIYAMGYEAVTGRLPDAVQLHFLDTGVIGRAEVDPRRLAKGASGSPRRRPASGPATTPPKPDRTTCGYCPFRAICPSSVGHVTGSPRRHRGDHVRLRQHARPGRAGRRCGGSSS